MKSVRLLSFVGLIGVLISVVFIWTYSRGHQRLEAAREGSDAATASVSERSPAVVTDPTTTVAPVTTPSTMAPTTTAKPAPKPTTTTVKAPTTTQAKTATLTDAQVAYIWKYLTTAEQKFMDQIDIKIISDAILHIQATFKSANTRVIPYAIGQTTMYKVTANNFEQCRAEDLSGLIPLLVPATC